MSTALAAHPRVVRPGRRLLGFSAMLVILALVAWMIQLFVFKLLIVPWYVAALGGLAAIRALVAFAKSPSIGRGVLALIVAGLGVLEGLFVTRATLLPEYRGPIAIGSSFPAFAAQRADGGSFTDADLRGRPTVLTFFRGRW